MEKVYQAKELSMAWCIECHNNPEPNLRPVEFVTKLDWEPEEGKTRKRLVLNCERKKAFICVQIVPFVTASLSPLG